jgi:hypothetical protein
MWQLLRVYYVREMQDQLLLECVAPIVLQQRDAGQLAGAYLDRHWLGGPHLKLYLQSSEERDVAMGEWFARRIGAYVKANPSRPDSKRLDDRMVRYMAQWELLKEPQGGPAGENLNLVYICQDDAQVERWEGSSILEAGRWFHSSTFGAVAALVGEIRRAPERRIDIAFDLLMYFADGISAQGLRNSHIMYRSHAEGFLASAGNCCADVRTQFEKAYEKRRFMLLQRLTERTCTRPHSKALEEYISRTKDLREKLLVACNAEEWQREVAEFREQSHTPDGVTLGRAWKDLGRNSEFHAVLAQDAYQGFMKKDVQFNVTRYSVNMVYATLLMLGISPIERYQLCWLLARAAEDAYGIDSLDVIKGKLADIARA